ncbi:hypothetical protein DB30_03577 [Enhygromyxa salina]|uniref:Uncharacterized protein n=1 Tax=Enhygromyxa salina TaxID=215803 RepID=A0A0C2CJV7_9BACT|nr:hypothetical protein DB30_03577 [Enhygromyxa salina]
MCHFVGLKGDAANFEHREDQLHQRRAPAHSLTLFQTHLQTFFSARLQTLFSACFQAFFMAT